MLRKLLILGLIALISTYSFNSEKTKSPELSRFYFRKGLESLKVLNYRDAIHYFGRAYSVSPKSYYGELAYLYLGKSYALFSYVSKSRKGIFAAIGYLNQYPFHYKVPRFIHTQREFVADAYLLLQWYETAKNIYANLYGETERPEYMIKYGYASSLEGGIEGYDYVSALNKEGVPADYLDLYYMTLGFYNFNLGKYKKAIDYMVLAVNVNNYLREDAHLLFRLGVSYYKTEDWRKSILYLELTLRNDPFSIYTDRTHYYLTLINLDTKNFRDAYAHLKKLLENDKLFYSKLSQILYSSLWLYEDFLKAYAGEFAGYRKILLDLGWLNVEDAFGELPALGLYYFSLKEKQLRPEEKEFLKVKRITLPDLVLEGEVVVFDPFVERVRSVYEKLRFFEKKEAQLISEIYYTNRDNFFRLFGYPKGVELLARSLVYLGDAEAKKLLRHLADRGVRYLLGAKLSLLEGRPKAAARLLALGMPLLKGDDLKEAKLLLSYLSEDLEGLLAAVNEIDFKHPRFSGYESMVTLKVADLLFEKGYVEESLPFYRRVVERGIKGADYWWAMFRIAQISEAIGDRETLRWVVNKAKEEDNIWSRAIRSLWEG